MSELLLPTSRNVREPVCQRRVCAAERGEHEHEPDPNGDGLPSAPLPLHPTSAGPVLLVDPETEEHELGHSFKSLNVTTGAETSSAVLLSDPFQWKYKEAGKKAATSSLYSTLPETLETQHARAASQLQSPVGGVQPPEMGG